MFRLLKEALASSSPPASPEAPRSSTTHSSNPKPDPPGKRVSLSGPCQDDAAAWEYESLQEVKREAKEEDWEVKRTIEAMTEWTKQRRPNEVQGLTPIEAVTTSLFSRGESLLTYSDVQSISRLESLISLPVVDGHVTTPLSAYTPNLRIRQTIFRTERGFETLLAVVKIISGHITEPSTENSLPESSRAEELKVEGLKLEDSEDSSAVPNDAPEPSVDRIDVLRKVLRVLYACLANERSRAYFDVSR